jgi:hypothetical protein
MFISQSRSQLPESNAAGSVNGSVSAGAGPTGSHDKQGKRGKRLEREALAERQQRAAELQARLDSEAQQVRERQEALQRRSGGGSAVTGMVDGEGAVQAGGETATGSAAAGVVSGDGSGGGSVQRCTTCGGAFTDAVKYRQHFR